MEHTRKEKQIINDAWHKLMYCADCTGNNYRLEQAYKYERKERKNSYTAKALILEQVRDLWVKHHSFNPMLASELTGVSQGILLGGLLGFESLIRVKDYQNFHINLSNLITEIEHARKVHSEAVSRSVEAIMKPYQSNEVKA